MGKQKINILLVDDKESNLIAIEQLLTNKERNIFKATSGEDALKMAFNKEFDLIILDVQMPGMDGFEVAQLLKSNKRTKDVPIIFATAEKKEQKFMMKGMEEGAVDYLFKPLSPEITEAKVNALLKLHIQKKELIEKNAALEKYVLLIDNCYDLICTIDADTFKFEEVNKAFKAILGYERDEISNTSLMLYLTDEDRFKVESLKKGGELNLDFETQVYCKSRELKWLHWHIVVKKGKWYANARDITEAKQVEEVKNYLSIVVKQSNDAIYLHDPNGSIISWNKGAEEMYGYHETEALKMKIWNIIPSHVLVEEEEAVARIIKGESIPSKETKRITKKGRILDVLFSASLVFNSENELKSIAITERDITEQKNFENQIKELNQELQKNNFQLQTTNKELESFSYSVSHDLRAPLRAINGYSRMIQIENEALINEDTKRLFGNIESNAKRMGTLIDDLLEFSRLGRKEVKTTLIDMTEMAERCLQDCSVGVKHSAKVKINPLPPVKADYGLLSQVFINLISNAIKYSGKKKKPIIEIGCSEKNQELVYFVKDNGAGFNMKYSDKLFGVFQRLHDATEYEGTGVGLAIVQRIIAKHKGSVWAEAKINEGATFYFSLPK